MLSRSCLWCYIQRQACLHAVVHERDLTRAPGNGGSAEFDLAGYRARQEKQALRGGTSSAGKRHVAKGKGVATSSGPSAGPSAARRTAEKASAKGKTVASGPSGDFDVEMREEDELTQTLRTLPSKPRAAYRYEFVGVPRHHGREARSPENDPLVRSSKRVHSGEFDLCLCSFVICIEVFF